VWQRASVGCADDRAARCAHRRLPAGRCPEETDDVAVYVPDRCDQRSATHVLDLLVRICAGVEERLEALVDVVDVPVGDRAGLAARPALIDGVVGVVWAVDGQPKVAWDLTISHGRIVHIDMLAARDSLDGLELTVLAD
jgi:hypothetical protein